MSILLMKKILCRSSKRLKKARSESKAWEFRYGLLSEHVKALQKELIRGNMENEKVIQDRTKKVMDYCVMYFDGDLKRMFDSMTNLHHKTIDVENRDIALDAKDKIISEKDAEIEDLKNNRRCPYCPDVGRKEELNESNKDLAENFLKFGRGYQDKAVYNYDVLRLASLFHQLTESKDAEITDLKAKLDEHQIDYK